MVSHRQLIESDAGLKLSLQLGQSPALIEAIRRGDVHPAMAAFGLWNDAELEAIETEIYADRERQTVRAMSSKHSAGS